MISNPIATSNIAGFFYDGPGIVLVEIICTTVYYGNRTEAGRMIDGYRTAGVTTIYKVDRESLVRLRKAKKDSND